MFGLGKKGLTPQLVDDLIMDDEEQYELRILVNSNDRRVDDLLISSLNSKTKRILFVERETSLGGSFDGLLFLKNDWVSDYGDFDKKEQEKDLNEFGSCVEDAGGLENKLVVLWGESQYEKFFFEKRLKNVSGCAWSWVFDREVFLRWGRKSLETEKKVIDFFEQSISYDIKPAKSEKE